MNLLLRTHYPQIHLSVPSSPEDRHIFFTVNLRELIPLILQKLNYFRCHAFSGNSVCRDIQETLQVVSYFRGLQRESSGLSLMSITSLGLDKFYHLAHKDHQLLRCFPQKIHINSQDDHHRSGFTK